MKSLPSRRSANRKRLKRKEKRLLEDDEPFQCKVESLQDLQAVKNLRVSHRFFLLAIRSWFFGEVRGASFFVWRFRKKSPHWPQQHLESPAFPAWEYVR